MVKFILDNIIFYKDRLGMDVVPIQNIPNPVTLSLFPPLQFQERKDCQTAMLVYWSILGCTDEIYDDNGKCTK